MSNYVEPRLRRDFGGIITAFFNFLKANIKGIINVFIGYNGMFFILFLISVYFLITGFVEFLILQNSVVYGGNVSTDSAAITMAIATIFLFLIIFIATIFNFSLCSNYLSIYEKGKKNNIPKREVWIKTKQNILGVILFSLLAVGIYVIYGIGYFILNLILVYIPLLPFIISIVLGGALNSWIGMALMSYIHNESKNILEAFGESWQLLFSGFWKAVGVNVVLGTLIQICIFSLQIVPGIIFGVIAFHAIEDSGSFTDSTISHILVIVFLTLFCIMFMFIQLLSQIINAFLYFNLHEFKNNEYLRSRITQIGSIE
ncbi:hypothetical protein [Nonlabens marinus]|uniref:Probable conserved transmembrane protein n=1 Tax=Nonlabens marinus S1-08 TaxID=1454201 RepID=W8VRV4_9FLAO|nr:hypothetical protein [Nonlabens marinus]BAO55840.1 probable conserved transmembrane protein [Nonlabens marinus S1-08]